MARKHKHEEHENHERWLVSYADFITLLFAFFTSMYAISNLDRQKAGRLVTSMQAAFDSPVFAGGLGVLGGPDTVTHADGSNLAQSPHPGKPPAECPSAQEADSEVEEREVQAALDSVQQSLQGRLDSAGIGEQVSFQRVGHELSLTLGEAILFEPGSADLRVEAGPALASISSVLAAIEGPIRIEGHTDDIPIKTSRYPSNWELSTARATAILVSLVELGDFAPNRFAAAGYGPYRPTAPNSTAAGRARNRRVEIVIVGEVVRPSPAPGPD